MELRTEVTQKQILSQHMVQSMEILQMSAQELEGYIENLALENPVIELPDTVSDVRRLDDRQVDLARKLEWLESTDQQNRVYYQEERSAEDMQENWHESRESKEELSDYLLSQLLLADYSQQERAIVEFLVLSLDARGYLTESVESVASYLSAPQELVERLLSDIQKLDPAGVGARDLKECLLLQLKRRGTECPVAETIVVNYIDDVAKNHLPEIARKLHKSMDEILDACEVIRSLNPKPGNSFASREQMRYISPDAVVVKLADQFEILINEYQYPSFSISSYYQDMLKHTTDEEAKKYLQEKISQAQWVSGCIAQRTSTLSRVMHALVERQNEFFLYGIGYKRPMRLVDLSEELGLHESTISRTLRGKYLQCAWGVFPLNYFLTSVATMSARGREEKTPEQIKALIRRIIDEEDKKKPLSDQAISQELENHDIRISRRTVNKYRTEMGLPDKSGRKSWES